MKVKTLHAGPLATVRTTLVDVYETAKCSEELIGIVALEKVPAMVGAVNIVKVCPMAGMKLLSSGAATAPVRFADPDT